MHLAPRLCDTRAARSGFRRCSTGAEPWRLRRGDKAGNQRRRFGAADTLRGRRSAFGLLITSTACGLLRLLIRPGRPFPELGPGRFASCPLSAAPTAFLCAMSTTTCHRLQGAGVAAGCALHRVKPGGSKADVCYVGLRVSSFHRGKRCPPSPASTNLPAASMKSAI